MQIDPRVHFRAHFSVIKKLKDTESVAPDLTSRPAKMIRNYDIKPTPDPDIIYSHYTKMIGLRFPNTQVISLSVIMS